MESVHSIIIIKRGNKYLNYFDDRWNMYLFPNISGNNINDIKNKYNSSNVRYLFDKVHEKFSISHNEDKLYHHFFYEVECDIDGEYFTLDELLNDFKVKKYNSDIIEYIKDYYKKNTN